MRSLVTGGLGFIGSHLVDKLVSLGDEVVVIDNMSSESSKLSHQNPKVKYHIDDVEMICATLGIQTHFDRIFHLAARARIQPSFKEPSEYFVTNAWGTMEVLEFCRMSGSGLVVYATTSSKNHGTHLLSPYTFSKVVGEDACRMFSEIYGLSTVCATFYNVYGPREPQEGEWATVVAKFLRQFREGDFLTVVGDGQQSRDFTHVSDICDGLIALSTQKFKGENFDLGRGEPIKVLDLAQKICSDPGRIKFVPLRKNEGLHTIANWQRTQDAIGWRAKMSLDEYLRCYFTTGE